MNPKKDHLPPQPDETFFPYANGKEIKPIEEEDLDEEELAEEG
jgi:hypothetical protein